MRRYSTQRLGQAAPQPASPSILTHSGPRNDRLALPQAPPVPAARLRWERIKQGAKGSRNPIFAGSTVAAGIPAAPGLARALEGRPGALPFLTVAGVIAAVAGVLNSAVAIYEARQKTRRKEIAGRSADTLAAAVARCIDDAHTTAPNLSGIKEIEEAARVRASARQILTDVKPLITALLEDAPRRAVHPDDDRRRR